MIKSQLSRVNIGADVLLDGRLALYHEADGWLAVADLHFGFEVSQCAGGNLFPFWGMQGIEDRLLELLRDYNPRCLILLGDLVHNRSTANSFARLVQKLRQICLVVLISGNHDRDLQNNGEFELVRAWRIGRFDFHHGHCAVEAGDGIQVIGHHHPAGVVRDGAGLRLKLPALVQQDRCWIMPAFSPWAAGTTWSGQNAARVWLCSPQRVFALPQSDEANAIAGP